MKHVEIRVDFAIVQDLRFQSPMNLWGTERRSEGPGAKGEGRTHGPVFPSRVRSVEVHIQTFFRVASVSYRDRPGLEDRTEERLTLFPVPVLVSVWKFVPSPDFITGIQKN